MRKKFTTNAFYFFLLSLLFISCKQLQNKDPEVENMFTKEKDPNRKMTDLAGALEYEFNMLKNPTTGVIPEGVFEAELAQAREILARQQLTSRIEAINAYIFQGPNNLGGRTRSVAYDIRYDGVANRIILAGGVSGGIYKSTDDGATWTRKSPTGEHFSCTSIAQDTRVGFRDTWYYGVGEASGNSATGSGAFYSGNGVYKSTDNGETWSRLTTSNTSALESFSTGADFISKIIVDPTDGNVYVACAAKIMRSTDGGTTWTDVLAGILASSNQHTDVVVSSTGRLYASFSGTNDSGVDGVWASPPGATSGDPGTWVRIAGAGAGGSPLGWNFEAPSGTPGGYGRVVLAIPPAAESFLYALYWNNLSFGCGGPAPEAELFRWDDIGATWTDISATLPNEVGCLAGNDPFAVQGGYDLVIAVKPDAPSTLFLGGTNAYRSTDAGLSWTRIGGYASPASYSLYASSHPDIHSFVFQPGSPSIMLCGNDGGIQRTTDCTAGSVSWTQINTGYRTYQYYYVAIDPRVANEKVIGGAQDNGSTRNIGGTGSSFEMVWGGDGVSVGLNDPAATGGTQYEYVGSQLGEINRRTSVTILGSTTSITPTGESGTGLFVTVFQLDQDNSQVLYYANDNALYRTTSASTVASGTWTSMTGVAGAITPASVDITALAATRGTYSGATASLFIGTSDGRVFRLDDPAAVAVGTAPEDIEDGDFPAGSISSIAVNPRNDDTVIVTLSNYGIAGNVWWTGNANAANPTWTNVEGTLTLPSFRSSAIHAVPNSPEVQYYVGTSVGLYRSGTGFPGTPGWAQEGASALGNAVISSMAFRPSDGKLLVGTHGYGMWYTILSLFPVPVELTDFKGTLQNNKTVLLQWTTSAEYNSKHFELERSFDGINFRKITTVAAAGNSTTTRQYSYVDREPLTERNYYRLRSVDMDNGTKLSNVIQVNLSNVQQDIQVLGNPFRNNTLVIRFVKIPEAKGELRLIDMAGRIVARKVIGPGEQQVEFNIPSAAAGTYILQAIIGNKTYTAKVLKE